MKTNETLGAPSVHPSFNPLATLSPEFSYHSHFHHALQIAEAFIRRFLRYKIVGGRGFRVSEGSMRDEIRVGTKLFICN